MGHCWAVSSPLFTGMRTTLLHWRVFLSTPNAPPLISHYLCILNLIILRGCACIIGELPCVICKGAYKVYMRSQVQRLCAFVELLCNFLLSTSFSLQITHSAAGCRLHCTVCTQLDSTSPVLLLSQPSLQPGLVATSNKHASPCASEEVNAGD